MLYNKNKLNLQHFINKRFTLFHQIFRFTIMKFHNASTTCQSRASQLSIWPQFSSRLLYRNLSTLTDKQRSKDHRMCVALSTFYESSLCGCNRLMWFYRWTVRSGALHRSISDRPTLKYTETKLFQGLIAWKTLWFVDLQSPV